MLYNTQPASTKRKIQLTVLLRAKLTHFHTLPALPLHNTSIDHALMTTDYFDDYYKCSVTAKMYNGREECVGLPCDHQMAQSISTTER